jgi:UDP-GlcNAc:undecaprenyl-phosphate GlcNAc-1-phosphate transferase
MSELLWMAGQAFLIVLVLTPILRDVFRSYNLVDRPGRRKVHAYPIPRLGGIAIAAGYVLALILYTHSRAEPDVYNWPAWKVVPGAAVIFLTGILDDVFTLRAGIKLVGQVVAAAVACSAGLRIESIAGMALPDWIGVPLTISWLLLATNAFNLIDGLDGLCTSMAVVGTGAFFLTATIQGNLPLQHAAILLAGALLGFLSYNFSPATTFLGDSGALSIGFLLGCFGVIWTQSAEPGTLLTALAVPLLALSVPLIDVGLAILRRFLAARPIFAPDRGHVHHRLLDRGLRPRRVLLALFLWAMLASSFAVLLTLPALHRWQGFVILGFGASAWAGVRQLKCSEFEVAARLIFHGNFRRTVQAQARLQDLADALELSHHENEWWERLESAARETGWSHIKWIHDQSVRRERSLHSRSDWSFRIALGDADLLEIEGPLETPAPPLDLHAFAQAVRASFEARSGAWTEPTLP